ncbi:MAG: hypothetical protein NXH75_07055 [Halobacteriovoraceae bacterium]|nr:hypothetical protein [Halobacteriovoraceae bacterium]
MTNIAKLKPKKDYSGIKFEVAEALGEWMNCVYLKQKKDGPIEHEFIHHKDSDGLSAITIILEREGHKVFNQPKLKVKNKPGFIKKLLALKKYIGLVKKVDIRWKAPREDITGIPPNFSRVSFTTEETQAIEQLAKENGVSENSYLLWSLDKAASRILLEEGSERKWISPLNFRQPDGPNIVMGNKAASILTNLKAGEISPKEIHQKIKSYLKSDTHWGSYIYSNMAKYIGFKGTLRVAKNIKEVGFGVFSHVGHWPASGDMISESVQDSPYLWRAVPAPPTQILPLAATCWGWMGRLSLCLQIHPSVSRDPELSEKIMEAWVKQMGLKTSPKVHVTWWKDFKETPKELIRN